VTDTIEAGTLLIADGTNLPAALHCESVPFATGWAHLRNLNSKGMNHIIEGAGWRFFFIAGVIEMVAFGNDEKQTAARALKRIIASLKARKHESLVCLVLGEGAVRCVSATLRFLPGATSEPITPVECVRGETQWYDARSSRQYLS